MRKFSPLFAFWGWLLGTLASAQTVGMPTYPDAPSNAASAPAAYPQAYSPPPPGGAPTADTFPSPYPAMAAPVENGPSALPPGQPPAGAANGILSGNEPASPAAPPVPAVEIPAEAIQPYLGFSMYGRVDAFRWTESADNVSESGALFTLGFQFGIDTNRFRLELFCGDVGYSDDFTTPQTGTTSASNSSDTTYIGTRMEFERAFKFDAVPSLSFIAGVGTRLWSRAVYESFANVSNTPVTGYDEGWWTNYPYLGLETRRQPGATFEWYASAHVGVTAFTLESFAVRDGSFMLVSSPSGTIITQQDGASTSAYPKPGMTESVELGIRYKLFNIAFCFDGLAWAQSSTTPPYQPATQMYQFGLKAGACF